MQENRNILKTLAVLVVNAAHDGYCRAGYRLASGENSLSGVTLDRLQLLEGDPRLSVYIIDTPDDNETPANHHEAGNVDADSLSSGVTQDGILPTPMPTNLVKAEGELTDPKDNFISAILASKIEPADKWFTKKGEPRLEQWRDVIGADVSAADIKAALAAHDLKYPPTLEA